MRGSGSRPFDLLRYFSGSSLAIIFVAVLGAGLASAALVREVFLRMERDEADSLSEYFITEFAEDGFTRSEWGKNALPLAARERAVADMRNFDVTELQLLAPDGRVLETLVAPGGAPSAPWDEGMREARSGRVALHWEAMGGWRSLLLSSEPSGAIESYVPVREGAAVVAVAKVRRDLAPAVVASQRLLFVIVALSALSGLAIFGALALLVRRADGLIRAQHAELIEARARLEERNRLLEELDRKKDLFYAACSHDLRSPLVSAHAGTRLVLTDPTASLSSLHRELLDESSRSVEGVLDLIANLLDIARIEARQDALETQPLDLKKVLDGVLSTHRRMAAALGVPLAATFPVGDVPIVGDRLKLIRVFGNLLSNAIQHAQGRPVEVVLERASAGARVIVRDEGTGIPFERRAVLFDWFARGAGETEHGAGLGLAIVREFVHRHGGTVTVESEPGQGTRFVVDLPASPRTAAAGPVLELR